MLQGTASVLLIVNNQPKIHGMYSGGYNSDPILLLRVTYLRSSIYKKPLCLLFTQVSWSII